MNEMNELALSFGAGVSCTDGKCGKLRAVAVNRDMLEVTHLIVEEGFLLKKARVFPFSLVARAAGDIELSIGSTMAADYPQFREETIETPGASPMAGNGYMEGAYHVASAPPALKRKVRHGVPDERPVLERGVPVITPDGRTGRLDQLLVDEASGRISGLVLEQGVLFLSRRFLPVEMIESVAESGIYIDATPEQLEALQPYAEENGEPAMIDPSATAMPDESRLVHPAGSDPSTRREAEPEAQPAPPAQGLGGAEDVKYRVARALDEDPRTADEPIEVTFERGIVTLGGFVASPQARAAAEVIAATQPGVISVVNTLKLDL
jgi:uncharacterized protein YrrD